MKIEVKITDEAGNVQQYVVSGSLLSDEEIEEYAKGVYGEEGEIWKRITNSYIVGAKWARDILKARQQQCPLTCFRLPSGGAIEGLNFQ